MSLLRETRFLTRRVSMLRSHVFSTRNFCNTRNVVLQNTYTCDDVSFLPSSSFQENWKQSPSSDFIFLLLRSFSFFPPPPASLFSKTKSDRVLKFSYQDTRNFCFFFFFFFFSLATSSPRRKNRRRRETGHLVRILQNDDFHSSRAVFFYPFFAGEKERRFAYLNSRSRKKRDERRSSVSRYNELIK